MKFQRDHVIAARNASQRIKTLFSDDCYQIIFSSLLCTRFGIVRILP